MKKTNRLIVGTALGVAAIAVAIDHTQHKLPDPVPVTQDEMDMSEEESPCGMGGMGMDSPCSMDSDSSPCGMGN